MVTLSLVIIINNLEENYLHHCIVLISVFITKIIFQDTNCDVIGLNYYYSLMSFIIQISCECIILLLFYNSDTPFCNIA